MCWTTQPDFGLLPHPPLPGSLLIIGNRGGSASFLRSVFLLIVLSWFLTHPPRYQTHENTIKIETNVSLSHTWITHIAASPWTLTSNAQCSYLFFLLRYVLVDLYWLGTSYLAFGTSDGVVGLARLNQTLATEEPSFAFIQNPSIVLSIEKADGSILDQDKAGITALEWVHTAGGSVSAVSRLSVSPRSSFCLRIFSSCASPASSTFGHPLRTQDRLGLAYDHWYSSARRYQAGLLRSIQHPVYHTLSTMIAF